MKKPYLISQQWVILLGTSLFENYSATIDIKSHLVHLPNISMQVRKKSDSYYLKSFIELQTTHKMVIPPFQQVLVPARGEATYGTTNGGVEATSAFERRDALVVSPALVTLTEGKTMLHITNPHSHTYTVDKFVAVTNFKLMTPQQAVNTKPVPHAHMLLKNNHPEEREHILSRLFHEQTENDGKRWYPIPETWDDPSKLNKIEKQIYTEIIILRGKEQLDPTKTDEQRKEVLSKFNWVESLLNEDKKAWVEHLLLKYHSIFARHRLDIGNITEINTTTWKIGLFAKSPDSDKFDGRFSLLVELSLT